MHVPENLADEDWFFSSKDNRIAAWNFSCRFYPLVILRNCIMRDLEDKWYEWRDLQFEKIAALEVSDSRRLSLRQLRSFSRRAPIRQNE